MKNEKSLFVKSRLVKSLFVKLLIATAVSLSIAVPWALWEKPQLGKTTLAIVSEVQLTHADLTGEAPFELTATLTKDQPVKVYLAADVGGWNFLEIDAKVSCNNQIIKEHRDETKRQQTDFSFIPKFSGEHQMTLQCRTLDGVQIKSAHVRILQTTDQPVSQPFSPSSQGTVASDAAGVMWGQFSPEDRSNGFTLPNGQTPTPDVEDLDSSLEQTEE